MLNYRIVIIFFMKLIKKKRKFKNFEFYYFLQKIGVNFEEIICKYRITLGFVVST